MTDQDKELVQLLHKDNLCTYFILPLLRLTKDTFGGDDNLANCYLTGDNLQFVVEVLSVDAFKHRIVEHPNFTTILYCTKYDLQYIVFAIPEIWKNDTQLFSEGLYSKMSEEAKDIICKNSGLAYRVPTATTPKTDVRLLALSRSDNLRQMWETMLDINLEDQELLSAPNERGVIDITSLTVIH